MSQNRNSHLRAKLFAYGFGLSLVLLAITASYGFSKTWRETVVAVIGEEDYRWSLPTGFIIAGSSFVLLNLPVIPLGSAITNVVGAHFLLSPSARAIFLMVICAALSAIWWWVVANGVRWLVYRRTSA